jgi:2-oxoisovalerate dehydrogenase E2 component (dihydrolipoyl transacylase)
MTGTKQGTTITMPKLGESVTEGTLGAWLKQVGDAVDKYEPMVEVVTDKVTAEIPAPVSGTIVEIIGAEGETIPVGGVICIIDEGGSSAGAAPVADIPQAADPAADAAMPADPLPAQASSEQRAPAAPIDLADARARRDEAELLRTRSSPVVRRLAEEHDIDLTTLTGSGIGGRVTKADILAVVEERRQPAAHAQQEPAPQPPAAPAPPPAAEPHPPAITPPLVAPAYAQAMPATQAANVQLMPGDEVHDASLMRRQIADHMVRSVQTAPHVTVWMEADMSNVVRVRERHKEEFQAREGFSLTYFPFLVRVVVQALRKHPNVNAAWDNGRIIRRKAINIGVAVALEDGLIVPVIKAADEKNLVGIARAVHDLSTRARANHLQPDEVTGGTFTLNNPGTLGSLFSTPIIVQPQAAILSMEAIVKRPVVIDDAIAIRPMMNLSLSIDHRILDGLAATRFLADVKAGLESFPPDAALD